MPACPCPQCNHPIIWTQDEDPVCPLCGWDLALEKAKAQDQEDLQSW